MSFRWSFGELIADDGQSPGTANGWAFSSYARHRAVAPLLDPQDLGSDDHAAPAVLLIDREANRATITPAAEAREFLRDQWPPMAELTPEQQAAFGKEFPRLLAEQNSQPVDNEAIARQMQEQRGRVGRLMSFLDLCPEPPERRLT